MKHKTVFGALQVGPYGMMNENTAWICYLMLAKEPLTNDDWQPIALNWGKKPLGQEGKK